MSEKTQNIENQRVANPDGHLTTGQKFDHLEKIFRDAGCHPTLCFEYAVKVAGICKAKKHSVLDVSIKRSADQKENEITIGQTVGDRVIVTKTNES